MTKQVPVPNLGELCAVGSYRDAVHIAVAPVVAGEELIPGDHVSLGEDQRAYGGANAIGIVDPFLCGCVQEGQTFWLFLYPNTITSLRHSWSHPAFKSKVPAAKEVNDVK